MTFLSGARLWLLLAAALLAGFYVWRQLQRRAYAVRFTNLALLESVAPRRPGWRRHVSAVALLVGLVAVVTAFAKPAHAARTPVRQTTIVLAVDVSGSMAATDVSPSRLEAAKQAASAFVKLLPARFDVGLVSFDRTASVVVAPTNDHTSVRNAIAELQLGGGTAIGEAIYSALGTIAATPQATNLSPSPARIVLMSDGATNAGRANDDAAQAAAEAHVPVTTIAYGTDNGQLTVGGQVLDVPVDKAALQKIADQTGGRYFEAASSGELNQVYDAIRTSVSYRVRYHDISAWFLGGGLILLVIAASAALLWSPMVP